VTRVVGRVGRPRAAEFGEQHCWRTNTAEVWTARAAGSLSMLRGAVIPGGCRWRSLHSGKYRQPTVNGATLPEPALPAAAAAMRFVANPGIHSARLQRARFRRSVSAGLLLTLLTWVFVAFVRARVSATSASISLSDLMDRLTDRSMALEWNAGLAVIAGLGAIAIGFQFTDKRSASNPRTASILHSPTRSQANLMGVIAILCAAIGFAVIFGSVVSGDSWLESGAVAILALASSWAATVMSCSRPPEDIALDKELDRRYLRARLLRQTRIAEDFWWERPPLRLWSWHLVALAAVTAIAVLPPAIIAVVRVFTGARAVASPLLMIPLGAGVAVMAGLLGFSLMCSLLDRDFTLTFVLLMALFFWLLSAVVVVMSVIYLQDSVMMRIGAGGAFGWLMLLPLAASLWATFARPPCRPFFEDRDSCAGMWPAI